MGHYLTLFYRIDPDDERLRAARLCYFQTLETGCIVSKVPSRVDESTAVWFLALMCSFLSIILSCYLISQVNFSSSLRLVEKNRVPHELCIPFRRNLKCWSTCVLTLHFVCVLLVSPLMFTWWTKSTLELIGAAYCEGHDTLENLCSMIPGDAQQYSLFRRDATPVECPFRGSYTFTYSRGHGECRSPVSRLDSCTESWRTFFRYQACPDVQGTESSGNN